MYIAKYSKENEMYAERAAVIRATDPITMLKHLGVNKKFIISDNFKFSQSSHPSSHSNFTSAKTLDIPTSPKSSNNSDSDSHHSSTLSDTTSPLPYHESIKALERISSYTSPRDKLDCVIDSFSNMKASIVDYWKGKVELQAMDDILPLTIYTV